MGSFGRLHLMVTRYLNHAGQLMRDSGIYFTIAHSLQIHACLFLYHTCKYVSMHSVVRNMLPYCIYTESSFVIM